MQIANCRLPDIEMRSLQIESVFSLNHSRDGRGIKRLITIEDDYTFMHLCNGFQVSHSDV